MKLLKCIPPGTLSTGERLVSYFTPESLGFQPEKPITLADIPERVIKLWGGADNVQIVEMTSEDVNQLTPSYYLDEPLPGIYIELLLPQS